MIENLPEFLKGGTLFQLSKYTLSIGTVFNIKCPPSFDIYVTYKENKGWKNGEFLSKSDTSTKSWELIEGSVSYTRNKDSKLEAITSYLWSNTSALDKIWKAKSGPGVSTTLPPITDEKPVAAIFLVEGKG